jgi:hypothetical protein
VTLKAASNDISKAVLRVGRAQTVSTMRLIHGRACVHVNRKSAQLQVLPLCLRNRGNHVSREHLSLKNSCRSALQIVEQRFVERQQRTSRLLLHRVTKDPHQDPPLMAGLTCACQTVSATRSRVRPIGNICSLTNAGAADRSIYLHHLRALEARTVRDCANVHCEQSRGRVAARLAKSQSAIFCLLLRLFRTIQQEIGVPAN